MVEKRCVNCLGSKMVEVGGGVKQKCPLCNGKGFVSESENDIEFLKIKEKEMHSNIKNEMLDKLSEAGIELTDSIISDISDTASDIVKDQKQLKSKKKKDD